MISSISWLYSAAVTAALVFLIVRRPGNQAGPVFNAILAWPRPPHMGLVASYSPDAGSTQVGLYLRKGGQLLGIELVTILDADDPRDVAPRLSAALARLERRRGAGLDLIGALNPKGVG